MQSPLVTLMNEVLSYELSETECTVRRFVLHAFSGTAASGVITFSLETEIDSDIVNWTATKEAAGWIVTGAGCRTHSGERTSNPALHPFSIRPVVNAGIIAFIKERLEAIDRDGLQAATEATRRAKPPISTPIPKMSGTVLHEGNPSVVTMEIGSFTKNPGTLPSPPAEHASEIEEVADAVEDAAEEPEHDLTTSDREAPNRDMKSAPERPIQLINEAIDIVAAIYEVPSRHIKDSKRNDEELTTPRKVLCYAVKTLMRAPPAACCGLIGYDKPQAIHNGTTRIHQLISRKDDKVLAAIAQLKKLTGAGSSQVTETAATNVAPKRKYTRKNGHSAKSAVPDIAPARSRSVPSLPVLARRPPIQNGNGAHGSENGVGIDPLSLLMYFHVAANGATDEEIAEIFEVDIDEVHRAIGATCFKLPPKLKDVLQRIANSRAAAAHA